MRERKTMKFTILNRPVVTSALARLSYDKNVHFDVQLPTACKRNNGYFSEKNGHFSEKNGHFSENNGHFSENNGHFLGNKPEH